jgi:hypothetical protein
VGRQLAGPRRVGDSLRERLLEPLRGPLGRVGQFRRHHRLRQEGQLDQGHLAPVVVQR